MLDTVASEATDGGWAAPGLSYPSPAAPTEEGLRMQMSPPLPLPQVHSQGSGLWTGRLA